ncbi:MAG: hypothetical protein GX347_02205 [Epulopiscium sp.]|nr:hypothetical protein [Candidatus Epulonipiscium sp.]
MRCIFINEQNGKEYCTDNLYDERLEFIKEKRYNFIDEINEKLFYVHYLEYDAKEAVYLIYGFLEPDREKRIPYIKYRRS